MCFVHLPLWEINFHQGDISHAKIDLSCILGHLTMFLVGMHAVFKVIVWWSNMLMMPSHSCMIYLLNGEICNWMILVCVRHAVTILFKLSCINIIPYNVIFRLLGSLSIMLFEWFDLSLFNHTISTAEFIMSNEMERMWIVIVRVFWRWQSQTYLKVLLWFSPETEKFLVCSCKSVKMW